METGIEQRKFFINRNKNRFKVSKYILFLGLILLGCIILSGAVSAANITVTPGTDAIKDAINTASNGDTLNLTEGIYNEHNITVNKNLTITGPQPTGNNPPTAVIDSQKYGRVFYIPSGVNLTLQYLLIQNGNAKTDSVNPLGGGVYNNGTLNINNCTIQSNTANEGGGIYNDYGDLFLNNSNINNNTATYSGGGIYNGSTTTLSNSNVNNNIVPEGNGGGIYNGGTTTLSNSNVNNNTATYYGGGICNIYDIYLTSSDVNNNTATDGGGIYSNGDATLLNSNVNNNTATDNGGGICNDGTTTLTNSNVNNNTATYYGGGIFTSYPMEIHFCRIIGNTAYEGADIYNSGDTVDAQYNWWGDNNNPNSKVFGDINITPWLVLNVNASPNNIYVGSNSTITVDLLHDNGILSDPNHPELYYHDPQNGHVPNGIQVNFTGILGSLNPTSTFIINGVGTTTFIAGAIPGNTTVYTIADSQTLNTPINIILNVDIRVWNYLWYYDTLTKTYPDNYVVTATPVYTLDVKNLGPNDATNVIVEYIIPTGIKFIAFDNKFIGTASIDATNKIITWNIGNMPSNGRAYMQIIGTVLISGTYTPELTTLAELIHVTENDTNSSNNNQTLSLNVPKSADIQVNQTVNNTNPNTGDKVTFTITTTNNGPDNATNIRITDNLPTGLTIDTSNPPIATQGTYTGGIWTIPTLNNGQTATLTITAIVTGTGTIKNTATKTTTTPTNDWNYNNNAQTTYLTILIMEKPKK